MSEKDYSLDALKKFLDYAGDKGLIKQNTAISRKAAANKILSVLEPNEIKDLRKVDLQHAFERFTNKQGTGFKPSSLQVYLSRLKTAMVDFESYVDNPSGFKPAANQRSSSAKSKSGNSGGKKKNTPELRTPEVHENEEENTESQGDNITIPIPLRPGTTVYLKNMPLDLTEKESTKIAAILSAYALTES